MQFPEQNAVRRKISHLLHVHQESKAAIRPHFFLSGPSGSGKSYSVKQLCEERNMSFFEMNAAQITAEGISGNSLSKAMRPLKATWMKPNVVFVDEFDKLFLRNGSDAYGHQSDVQDEFLTMLESEKTSVFGDYGKYEPVKVDNTLFIFAGAFNGVTVENHDDLLKAGIRPEFIGRVPLMFSMPSPELDSLLKAVQNSSLLDSYCDLYRITGKARKETVEAIQKGIQDAYAESGGVIGIRMINHAIHTHFLKD